MSFTEGGGVYVSRIEYTSVSFPDTTVVLDDVFSCSCNKSTEIKNNILSLNLKNLPLNFDGTNVYGNHVLNDYSIRFKEGDTINFYFKLTNDPDDFTDYTNWVGTDTLAGSFVVREFQMQQAANSSRIALKTTDAAYIMFNKVWTYDYGGGSWTMPGTFRHVIRNNTEGVNTTINNYSGTNNDAGVLYPVEANFTSEGGQIQDYRTVSEGGPSAELDGALNDSDVTITVNSTSGFKSAGTIVITDGSTTEHVSYTGITGTTFTGCVRGIDDTKAVSHLDETDVFQGFPIIGIHKIWKALFEWFGELIDTNQTNYVDELGAGSTPFYNRAFLFYMDANNKFHVLPADDNVDLELDLGEEDFTGMNLTKSVFDSVNFVIFSCGEDMYGNGITWYYYDDSSDVGTLKMKYQPLTDISTALINSDLLINDTRDTTNQDIYRQFPDSGEYPLSSWGFKTQQNSWEEFNGDSPTTSIANDSEYNSGLRDACKWQGLQKAKNITLRMAGLRYKGQVSVKGQIINPGDLIQVTNKYTGLVSQKIRVLGVTHSISNGSVITTLNIEEDEKILGG